MIGLLALPTGLKLGTDPASVAAAPIVAATDASSLAPAVSPAVAPAASLDLPVTNMLRLPNGLAFEIVETATGVQTVVSEVPDGLDTDLMTGDILLVYVPSGEMLGTSTALREILQREFANGITTYSFVIRRATDTLDAEFRLGATG